MKKELFGMVGRERGNPNSVHHVVTKILKGNVGGM